MTSLFYCKDHTIIESKPQQSDNPFEQAHGGKGKEKLPFNRREPLAESLRGRFDSKQFTFL